MALQKKEDQGIPRGKSVVEIEIKIMISDVLGENALTV